jgi:hypothetical protein
MKGTWYADAEHSIGPTVAYVRALIYRRQFDLTGVRLAVTAYINNTGVYLFTANRERIEEVMALAAQWVDLADGRWETERTVHAYSDEGRQ